MPADDVRLVLGELVNGRPHRLASRPVRRELLDGRDVAAAAKFRQLADRDIAADLADRRASRPARLRTDRQPRTDVGILIDNRDRTTRRMPHRSRSAKPVAVDTGEPNRSPGPARAPERTRSGALWAGLILSAVVLVVLLAFIVQNSSPVEIYFLV